VLVTGVCTLLPVMNLAVIHTRSSYQNAAGLPEAWFPIGTLLVIRASGTVSAFLGTAGRIDIK
jgi:hypothetical protein